MELIVGQNTYATVEEFDEILDSYLTSSQKEDMDFISDEDKAVVLYKSCIDMQKLPYRGFRLNAGQKLAFPRINRAGQKSDEELVKLAQVVNAISFLSNSEVDGQTSLLRKNGINTFRLGQFSISLDKSYNANKASNSGSVESILPDWLKGGVVIR